MGRDYTKLNVTLMRVFQESLVAISTVAIKAVLADPDVSRSMDKGLQSVVCSCDRCSE